MNSDPGAGTLFGRLKNRLSGDKKVGTKDHLEKEIVTLHESHKIDDTEFSMLEGILDFQGKTAREVMVPRTDAFMVDREVSFQDNLDEILREPYSRIPVYQRDKDKIVGIIHIRTVLRKAKQKGFDNLDYKDVMTEPLFAPETAELGDLLMEMQQTQRQLAILTDEYSRIKFVPSRAYAYFCRSFPYGHHLFHGRDTGRETAQNSRRRSDTRPPVGSNFQDRKRRLRNCRGI